MKLLRESPLLRIRFAWWAAWLVLLTLTGLGSALFLTVLQWVTESRHQMPWLFLLAPFAGAVSAFFYTQVSKASSPGNLLIAKLVRHSPEHEPGRRNRVLDAVPILMAPLIVVSTWLSHLTGVSVGREGTAVQMGGSLASLCSRLFELKSAREEWRLLLAGVAAGFASVFGVPLAGAIFALELSGVFKRGPRDVRSIKVVMICILSAWYADSVTKWIGVGHAIYPQWESTGFGTRDAIGFLVASLSFGYIAWGFLKLVGVVRTFWNKTVSIEWLRPTLGGLVLALVFFVPPLWRYAGLGTDVIEESFTRRLPLYESVAKVIMTSLGLGFGFKGGEVTPLFFIGSTFASALSGYIGVDPARLASLGLVAVFGAAAGVPVACAVMAGELFGWTILPIALPVCLLSSYVCRTQRLYDEI